MYVCVYTCVLNSCMYTSIHTQTQTLNYVFICLFIHGHANTVGLYNMHVLVSMQSATTVHSNMLKSSIAQDTAEEANCKI